MGFFNRARKALDEGDHTALGDINMEAQEDLSGNARREILAAARSPRRSRREDKRSRA